MEGPGGIPNPIFARPGPWAVAGTRAGILRNRQPLVALCAPSSLRALQTTRNPPETAAVGARRPRRGATSATLR